MDTESAVCRDDPRRARSAWAYALLLILVLGVVGRAAGAQEVGTIAALEGSGKIGRGNLWITATPGAAIQLGDELRTEPGGRMRVVFQDDTVLTISDDSRVVVNEQVFDPNRGKARSVLGLLQGKVSALVSEYYQRSGAVYQIKTATAVAGVRGTEFVVIYDPREDRTEVAGLSGTVEVMSAFDRTGRGVFITAQEVTSVWRGQFPSPPQHLSDSLFRGYIKDMDFIGASAAESLTLANPLLAGQIASKGERAAVAATSVAPQRRQLIRERRDVSSLLQQTPAVFGPGGTLRITF
jgi:FecR protein